MIKLLSKSVADKIAAGEVVERPLSIVKELVENSIDAGATNIVVEIKDGGKSYIRVSDNGEGIVPEECKLAFLRHATSKIEKAEDLDEIYTLGFRGEALASICAVSRVEMITKRAELKVGRRVLVNGGEFLSDEAYGCPDGTTIIVQDLFYNTPARRKFLKSTNAESGAVTEFVTQVALAYPHIKVRMVVNERILFATNGKGDRLKTIGNLTSKVHTDNLIPFTMEQGGISIEGYVSGPGESKSSRKYQVFFVNGRVINSKIIEKGISQAYRERLFDGRYPICYLFLNIPAETMDVNIHPNKREVRFHDDNIICDFVRESIISALNTKEAIPQLKESPKKQEKIFTFKDYRKDNNIIKEKVDINNIMSTYEKSVKRYADKQENFLEEKVEIKTETNVESKKFDFSKLEIVGQFFSTYIQLKDDEAIYFIDQHAAHERIFYEKILKQYEESEKLKQTMLLPITVDVTFGDKEKEEQWLPPLNKMGFTIDEFGPLTYRVTEIPMFFDMGEAEEFLNDYIDNIGNYSNFSDQKTLDKIATRACKAAVKANDSLSREEIESLLKDMSSCENPFSCPHGRPTFIKITQSDMEKRFKRK
ncbi:MAG: DNA mismatch repair endonuclease MutL [Eubacterium sp.]|nr:DNA mismatch repair endonuclease MutL [Eubacterium sp.]